MRDAYDRYSNQEVSYLLQRLEEYDGLIVLATNLRANFDGALIRRFDAVLRLSMPTEDERRRIWLAAMPRYPAPANPEVFAAALARFELSRRAIGRLTLKLSEKNHPQSPIIQRCGRADIVDCPIQSFEAEPSQLKRY